MSFIAKINIDGEELNVLHCSFRFTQITDATGKPTAVPQGGNIKILLESTGSTNLFDWMISPTQTKSGEIIFYRRDSMSKMKTIEFSEAHCVDYYESFDSEGKNPMQIQIVVSAREIRINDSEYKNNWPE